MYRPAIDGTVIGGVADMGFAGRVRVSRAVDSAHSARRKRQIVWRALDLILAGGALVFFAPLFVLIAILIKLEDGGPVLFSQMRVGKGGRMFRCRKFRSMTQDAEARLAAMLAADPRLQAEWEFDHKLKRDPRITRVGDFLRRSSLDELPQLINILTGSMSVVGPRPVVESEIRRYGRWYPYYAAVKPGLTGLWQVSGRNDVSYRRRVAMDRLYVRRQNLELYVYIVAATVPAVLMQRGSY